MGKSQPVVEEEVRILETRAHPMQGKPPDGSANWEEFSKVIGTYPSIAPDFYEGDPEPFHVILDVFKVGETSTNGMHYDETVVQELEQQLPGKGGILGHVPDDELDTAFPIEEIDWVGHTRVGDTTWAKGYIPPGKTRGFIRRLTKRGGSLRTSIDATGIKKPIGDGKWVLRKPKLDRLDLAPSNRASQKLTSGKPAIVREMGSKKPVSDFDFSNVTLSDIPERIREQIATEAIQKADLQGKAARVTELEQQVQEMRQYASIVGEVRITLGQDADIPARVKEMHDLVTRLTATLNEKEYANISVRVEEMHEQIREFKKQKFEGAVESRVTELTNWQVKKPEHQKQVDAFRLMLKNRILAAMGDSQDTDRVTETTNSLWEAEFKPLAEALVGALAGPSAAVAGRGVEKSRYESNDWEKEAREKFGLNGKVN